MKSSKVLKILNISRQTLVKYVKNGDIRVVMQTNKQYDYNEEDVYRKAGLSENRVNVVYARVSTSKQKRDLENQAETLINYCNANGVKVDKVYKDIASGMNFDRKQFRSMLEDVLNYRISSIYITYKDRFSRISFDMFERLFLEYNCKIIVINKTESTAEEDEKEIFSDIISMLHCFAMKMYSRRRKKKMELIKEDLKNELDL
ncbi:inosine-5'-monophosphate dehydrogenase [Phocaeicola coprophilus CAG:333]|uniref:IS607 family transposase n=1 Tax=Phocaeicola coprophilus TaxID=387090 RepID=UPI00033D7B6C|nr:IS607 family transposase [Phocaeicola coprophilus]CDC55641.1 inosine-5'-monophosphate dehydrogenase [Phocaeicola coprophilus CAG:333]